MPDVKFGIVDMMVNGKLLPVTTKPSELMKPCAELRTWTLESQAALWLQVMNFALKMMDFALKMMNFALKMMYFSAFPLLEEAEALHLSGSMPSAFIVERRLL